MRKTLFALFCLLAFGCAASSVSTILSYQGRLTNNDVPVTGTKSLRFAIINAAQTVLWQSNTSLSVAVAVQNGNYLVKLGDTTVANMAELPVSVFDKSQKLYLRVWVDSSLLTPDVELAAVPYATIARQTELITKNAEAGRSIANALSLVTQSVSVPVTLNVKALTLPNGVIIATQNNLLTIEY